MNCRCPRNDKILFNLIVIKMKKMVLSLFAVLAMSIAIPQKTLARGVELRRIEFSTFLVVETVDCYEFYEKIDGEWWLVSVQLKLHSA